MKNLFVALSVITIVAISGCASVEEVSVDKAKDIAGVQIGNTYSSAKALMASSNPYYQLNDLKKPDGRIYGISAQVISSRRVIEKFVVLLDESGAVWFAARAQILGSGNRIKSETLLDSLFEKYGPPSGTVPGRGPLWQFNREGKIHRGSLTRGPCFTGYISESNGLASMGFSGARTTFNGTYDRYSRAIDNIESASMFVPNCGFEISTSISKDPDGMVWAYAVHIVDYTKIYDEKNNKKIKEKADRQELIEREKTKDAKPIL